MGLTFFVNEHVLIPRQDTEILVEEVLKSLAPNAHVLDMCTGSGCILVSIMKYASEASGTGVDISEEALIVAQRNAEQHQVNARFLQSNLFANVKGIYDVIVSNPPYIRTSVIEELEEEVKLHDPFIALDGKEDGLYFYRKIVDECREFLKPGGSLYFEIGHDQGQEVKELMEQQGFDCVTVKKDLAGLDRVVFGVYNI
jgi:release factor glutamine methyltransferase